MKRRTFIQAVAAAALSGGIETTVPSMQAQETPKNTRPNSIVILTDDMGSSDLGCYGAEISTPNLDALAGNGLRFTQFYNTARCCPTRASLLSGQHPHRAGVGHRHRLRSPGSSAWW